MAFPQQRPLNKQSLDLSGIQPIENQQVSLSDGNVANEPDVITHRHAGHTHDHPIALRHVSSGTDAYHKEEDKLVDEYAKLYAKAQGGQLLSFQEEQAMLQAVEKLKQIQATRESEAQAILGEQQQMEVEQGIAPVDSAGPRYEGEVEGNGIPRGLIEEAMYDKPSLEDYDEDQIIQLAKEIMARRDADTAPSRGYYRTSQQDKQYPESADEGFDYDPPRGWVAVKLFGLEDNDDGSKSFDAISSNGDYMCINVDGKTYDSIINDEAEIQNAEDDGEVSLDGVWLYDGSTLVREDNFMEEQTNEQENQEKAGEYIGESIYQDVDEVDHEVNMAQSDLYDTIKNIQELREILEGIDESEGIPAWVQAKLTQASDYINSAVKYLQYEDAKDEGGELEMAYDEDQAEVDPDEFDPDMYGDDAMDEIDADEIDLGKRGLWDNIHAKRERGERMREPGEEGAPTAEAFRAAQSDKSHEEYEEDDAIRELVAAVRELIDAQKEEEYLDDEDGLELAENDEDDDEIGHFVVEPDDEQYLLPDEEVDEILRKLGVGGGENLNLSDYDEDEELELRSPDGRRYVTQDRGRTPDWAQIYTTEGSGKKYYYPKGVQAKWDYAKKQEMQSKWEEQGSEYHGKPKSETAPSGRELEPAGRKTFGDIDPQDVRNQLMDLPRSVKEGFAKDYIQGVKRGSGSEWDTASQQEKDQYAQKANDIIQNGSDEELDQLIDQQFNTDLGQRVWDITARGRGSEASRTDPEEGTYAGEGRGTRPETQVAQRTQTGRRRTLYELRDVDENTPARDIPRILRMNEAVLACREDGYKAIADFKERIDRGEANVQSASYMSMRGTRGTMKDEIVAQTFNRWLAIQKNEDFRPGQKNTVWMNQVRDINDGKATLDENGEYVSLRTPEDQKNYVRLQQIRSTARDRGDVLDADLLKRQLGLDDYDQYSRREGAPAKMEYRGRGRPAGSGTRPREVSPQSVAEEGTPTPIQAPAAPIVPEREPVAAQTAAPPARPATQTVSPSRQPINVDVSDLENRKNKFNEAAGRVGEYADQGLVDEGKYYELLDQFDENYRKLYDFASGEGFMETPERNKTQKRLREIENELEQMQTQGGRLAVRNKSMSKSNEQRSFMGLSINQRILNNASAISVDVEDTDEIAERIEDQDLIKEKNLPYKIEDVLPVGKDIEDEDDRSGNVYDLKDANVLSWVTKPDTVKKIESGKKDVISKGYWSQKPLEKKLVESSSEEAVGENIGREMDAGKPHDQAVAIALENQRRMKQEGK